MLLTDAADQDVSTRTISFDVSPAPHVRSCAVVYTCCARGWGYSSGHDVALCIYIIQ